MLSIDICQKITYYTKYFCRHRLAWPRTPRFQCGNSGSNPDGGTKIILLLIEEGFLFCTIMVK